MPDRYLTNIEVAALDESAVNAGPVNLFNAIDFVGLGMSSGQILIGGLLPEDSLEIIEGNDIEVVSGEVRYDGGKIGNVTGGENGAPLQIDLFIGGVTIVGPEAIDALLGQIGFETSSNNPTATRDLTFALTDPSGAVVPILPEFANSVSANSMFAGTPSFGNNAVPVFEDLDYDGDLDLVVADDNGTLSYFKNTGDATAPNFVLQIGNTTINPFQALSSFSPPGFGDLDGDGMIEMISVSSTTGELRYFIDSMPTPGDINWSNVGVTNPFSGVVPNDTGSVPVLVDLDGDGDLDLVVGRSNDTIDYYQNVGTASAPVFQVAASNPFGGFFDQGSFSYLSFSDLDGDGDLDAALGGTGNGNLFHLENVGSVTAPSFVRTDGSSSIFDRSAACRAAVCALHWPTSMTTAMTMLSTASQTERCGIQKT